MEFLFICVLTIVCYAYYGKDLPINSEQLDWDWYNEIN